METMRNNGDEKDVVMIDALTVELLHTRLVAYHEALVANEREEEKCCFARAGNLNNPVLYHLGPKYDCESMDVWSKLKGVDHAPAACDGGEVFWR